MKTLATTFLTMAFLAAGGFTNFNNWVPAGAASPNGNVTVINKNQVWPVIGMISVEPCTHSRCIDI